MIVPETFPGAEEINRAKLKADLTDCVRGINIKHLMEEVRKKYPDDYGVTSTVSHCIDYIRENIIDNYAGAIIEPHIDHEGKLRFSLSFAPPPGLVVEADPRSVTDADVLRIVGRHVKEDVKHDRDT